MEKLLARLRSPIFPLSVIIMIGSFAKWTNDPLVTLYACSGMVLVTYAWAIILAMELT